MRRHQGRCGWIDYARLLRMVIDRNWTTKELSGAFGLTDYRLRLVLRVMAAMGLVMEVALRRGARGNQHEVVWGVMGPPAPPRRGAGAVPDLTDVMSFCRVVQVLMREPLSADEVAEAAGTARSRTRPLIAEMSRLRLVRVSMWRRAIGAGSRPSAMVRWCVDGRDAERPRPQSQREMWARYKEMRKRRAEARDLLFMTAGRPAPRAHAGAALA